ncbi:MAG TPA: PDZ domain-containing protein [Actinomycetota bacterium]|nr:PDZ domain-containing protein [Actinomycetota bacterium]
MAGRRSVVALILLALALGACAGADPSAIRGAIEAKKQEGKTTDVGVPPQPDLERTGRVGVSLATNSVGWEKTLGTAAVDGAVVLLVNPGSPAERAGIKRGDVITHIGGSVIRSDERARVGLRGRPGAPLRITIARGETTMQIDVVPGPPVDVDFLKLVDAMLEKAPADATSLLLRAQATDAVKDSITYVTRAINIAPDLIDALVFRARLFWVESLQVTNDVVIKEDRDRAADDYRQALEIDPDATTALRSRATGALEISDYDAAERDGLRAIGIDPTLPEAYLVVAAARYSLGRIRDSVGPAHEAIQLDPYNPSSYRLLALAFVALGRSDDARKTVEVGLTVATDENQRASLRAVVEE